MFEYLIGDQMRLFFNQILRQPFQSVYLAWSLIGYWLYLIRWAPSSGQKWDPWTNGTVREFKNNLPDVLEKKFEQSPHVSRSLYSGSSCFSRVSFQSPYRWKSLNSWFQVSIDNPEWNPSSLFWESWFESFLFILK